MCLDMHVDPSQTLVRVQEIVRSESLRHTRFPKELDVPELRRSCEGRSLCLKEPFHGGLDLALTEGQEGNHVSEPASHLAFPEEIHSAAHVWIAKSLYDLLPKTHIACAIMVLFAAIRRPEAGNEVLSQIACQDEGGIRGRDVLASPRVIDSAMFPEHLQQRPGKTRVSLLCLIKQDNSVGPVFQQLGKVARANDAAWWPEKTLLVLCHAELVHVEGPEVTRRLQCSHRPAQQSLGQGPG
mmetsp:Transcript_52212/g.113148  ORF Transcript_52212/g.113148 Transcript_52212/m.113148 type:complete len:240 (+) Transcript_52212:195-914(+)